MNFRKDQKGFSIIEMVVAIGIIAIMAAFSLNMLGRLRTANAEKAVQTISSALRKLQVSSMSKSQKPYLYLYKVDSVFYMVTDDSGSLLYSDLVAKKGIELGSGLTISTKSSITSSKSEITSGNILKIYYLKNGKLGSDVNIYSIIVGTPNSVDRQIKFNKETGKHVTGYAE